MLIGLALPTESQLNGCRCIIKITFFFFGTGALQILKLILVFIFAFPSLVLGVSILPPVQSMDSAESVSFPEEDKPTGNINLPASLMWRAQLEGYHFIHL